MKLYDRATSPNCHRPRLVLYEKGIAFETIPVDLPNKEQKTPQFLAMNPYGKVPVLVDGETIVYESCIINEYLEDKYPDPALMPKDPGLRAKIRILIDYGVNHTYPAYERLRNDMFKEEAARNSQVISTAIADLRALLKRLDAEVQDKTYLAGDFSLLDIALVPRFLRLDVWGVFADDHLPNLRRWLDTMKTRASVQKIMASGMPQGHGRRAN